MKQVIGTIRRGFVGLVLLGGLTATLSGSALASAPNTCHNPSGCPVLVLPPTPTIDADATYSTIDVWGRGFTPGDDVAIIVTDSQTKALEAGTVVVAVGGNISWYGVTKDRCEGGNVPRIVNARDLNNGASSNQVLAGCH